MILSTALRGVTELQAGLRATTVRVDAVTVVAMRAAQRKIITEVRKNLRGEPRWSHRGRSRVYPESVTKGSGHSPRGGPPGKFTGDLYRGVGGKKTLVSIGGRVEGGAGVGGGKKLRQNNFKKRWEKKYPFFAPAVNKVQKDLPEVYATAWRKALDRRGGL